MRSLATFTIGAMIKRALIFSLACAALLLRIPLCHAQEGSFDPTFGDSGRLLVDVSVLGHSDVLQRLILLPSGKLLMSGTCDYQYFVDPDLFENTFCVTQLLSDGTYDGTFGPGGLGYIQFGASVGATTRQWIIDRLSKDGGRDATFNQGNPQTLSIAPGNGGAVERLALTNDGIFAIGETPRTSGSTINYAAIVRLKADGSLDSKFGNGGKSYFSFTSTQDFNTSGSDVAVSKSGLIVAGTQNAKCAGRLRRGQIRDRAVPIRSNFFVWL